MDNSDPNNPNQPSAPNPLSTPDLNQGLPVSDASNPAGNPLPDPGSIGSAPPAADPAASPWANPAPLPQDPSSSAQPSPDITANPTASNPFLQPQTPAAESTPQGLPPTDTAQAETIQPSAPNPLTPSQATENIFQPNQGLPQDPLNTAFTPGSNPNEANPFGPSAPLQPPSTPQSPAAEPVNSEPQNSAPQQSPGNTLDLSSLQANPPPAASTEAVNQQPGAPLPETGPVENAPTDLSHLIAGDEEHQQPGDIYNPPVVPDHNPALTQTQTSTEPGGVEPPHGKHLNLTKVLLVVGIPIILIVAALSAYLILGIGKTAPEQESTPTSLPVETQQAPLTNPPQKITAPSSSPSQALLSSPNTSLSTGSATLPLATGSPAASLSPAMKAAQRQVSPSPAASASISP